MLVRLTRHRSEGVHRLPGTGNFSIVVTVTNISLAFHHTAGQCTVWPRSIAVQPRLSTKKKKKHTTSSWYRRSNNCLLIGTCAAKSAVSSERSQNSKIGTCSMDSPLGNSRVVDLQLHTAVLYDHRKPRPVVFAGSIALISPTPMLWSTGPSQEREDGYHQAQQCEYGPESAVDYRQRSVVAIVGRGV
jgi:hypothetical protein